MQIPANYIGYAETKLGADNEAEYWIYDAGEVNAGYAENGYTYCANNVNGTPKRGFDYSNVNYLVLRFEPINFDNVALHIGSVEVKVNGQWKKVFDASHASVSEGENYGENIGALAAGTVTMAPYVGQSTCSNFTAVVYEGKTCSDHEDANADNCCDRCLVIIPCAEHMDLDEDGICDVCESAVTVADKNDNEPASDSQKGEDGTDLKTPKTKGQKGNQTILIVAVAAGIVVIAVIIGVVVAVKKKHKSMEQGKKEDGHE